MDKCFKMDEQNPLQACLLLELPVTNNRSLNKSGRPTARNMINFGPQPKSIIAQMLTEAKNKNVTDDKDEIVCLDDQSADSLEIAKPRDHICSVCSFRSNSTKDHKRHEAQHKMFFCDFPNCSYSCKLSSNLIKHKRVHTNEKPYLCEKCCFRSNFVNSLKVHKRTHTAERPYQCVHCSYKCNSSSNLKKHCRHRHPECINCECSKP